MELSIISTDTNDFRVLKLPEVCGHVLNEPRFLKNTFKCLILDDNLKKLRYIYILDLLGDLYFHNQVV